MDEDESIDFFQTLFRYILRMAYRPMRLIFEIVENSPLIVILFLLVFA